MGMPYVVEGRKGHEGGLGRIEETQALRLFRFRRLAFFDCPTMWMFGSLDDGRPLSEEE
jgi:hypothetical protein